MKEIKDITINSNLKRGVKSCLIATLLSGVFFLIVFQQFTIEGIGYTFLLSAMYSFALGLGNSYLNSYLSSKWSWITQTNKRVWLGVIATILYTVPVVLGINYFQYVVLSNQDPENFFRGNMIFLHLFWVLFAFAISIFFHARGFMQNWKTAMTKETTIQEIVAKTETAKFESLKNQLDPHFLFNSLNVLTSLIGENPPKAEKFTTKLSKIYRYVLEQRNKELIPLEEELNFAKAYMDLLGMRFEDAVKFTIPASVSNSELKIVPLSLQLLLENAVKHNVVSASKPLEIQIFEKEGYLHIQNNNNPKEAIGKSTKVGLRNIADRYGLLTHKNVLIENNNKTFTVSLPLLDKTQLIMNTEDFENSNYVKAVEKVQRLKEFYQNLTSYCLVIPFLIFINLQFSPGFQWFWFPAFGWGIGLAFHFLDVNNYNIFLGSDWEEKKIQKLMKAKQQKR
tara:strand:+ start:823 stop:2178 length:1356 start_codon:yes stop_codon:yes gene_type:complete